LNCKLGTLGAGNHYAEIQVVEEIYDKSAAAKMGIDRKNQVCILIHSGSRGLGHQGREINLEFVFVNSSPSLLVATDALMQMEKAMARDKIHVNDRQLACARINSQEGKDYLAAMAAAANFAWVNRQSMTFLTRQAFAKAFNTTPDDLGMMCRLLFGLYIPAYFRYLKICTLFTTCHITSPKLKSTWLMEE